MLKRLTDWAFPLKVPRSLRAEAVRQAAIASQHLKRQQGGRLGDAEPGEAIDTQIEGKAEWDGDKWGVVIVVSIASIWTKTGAVVSSASANASGERAADLAIEGIELMRWHAKQYRERHP